MGKMGNFSTPDNICETQFEQLMLEYKAEIFRLCYFYLIDRDLAEDAISTMDSQLGGMIEKYSAHKECSYEKLQRPQGSSYSHHDMKG